MITSSTPSSCASPTISPAKVRQRGARLDPDHEDRVAPGAGQLRVQKHVLGPVDPPGVAVDERDVRPRCLEVVELLGIDVAEALRRPGLREEARRERGPLRAVVPAAKRGHHDRAARSSGRDSILQVLRHPWSLGAAVGRGACPARRTHAAASKRRERHDRSPDARWQARRGSSTSHQGSWFRHCTSPTTICRTRRPKSPAASDALAPRARPAAEERGHHDEEGHAEDGRRAHVDLDRLLEVAVAAGSPRPRSAGPAAVTSVPGDDEDERDRNEREPEHAEPPGDGGGLPPLDAGVGAEEDDDREGDRDEGEQEVRHHDQRVELVDDRDPARGCPARGRGTGARGPPRRAGRETPARHAAQAAKSVARPTTNPTTRLPNST